MARLRGARPGLGLNQDLMAVLHVIGRTKAGLAWAVIAVDMRQGTSANPR